MYSVTSAYNECSLLFCLGNLIPATISSFLKEDIFHL